MTKESLNDSGLSPEVGSDMKTRAFAWINERRDELGQAVARKQAQESHR